jgi:hypothetical protein
MSLSGLGEQDIAYSTAGLEYSMNARIRGLEDQFRGSNAAPRVGVHRRRRSSGERIGVDDARHLLDGERSGEAEHQ